MEKFREDYRKGKISGGLIEEGTSMIRKIIKIVAVILCLALIVDGLYKVLSTGTNDWGLVIMGGILFDSCRS